MSLRIATADVANVSQLAAIHAQCFSDPWSCESFSDLLVAPGSIALLGGMGAGDSGLILARVASDECEILTIGTIPDRRRSGLARSLLHEAAHRAHVLGAKSMFLEVAEDNDAARALYASCGFLSVGRRTGYYKRPGGKIVDALVWRAALPFSANGA